MEQPELKVTEVPTGSLVPYTNNAKLHSKLQVEQIANSIQEFGFNDPIGVWENPQGELEIVEGHGRVLAAEKLGIATVPIVRLDHLTDEQRRAYTHVHNQTTLDSGFDLEILDVELETLNFDWEEFGFEIVSEDGFGTDFSLPDADAPQFKSMSLQMTQEQFGIIQDALSMVGECSTEGGNKEGRKVAEVCLQWARR